MKGSLVLATTLFTGSLAILALLFVGPLGSDALAAQRGGGRGGPPAPCGPAGDLSVDLATNVAADSRCFELRMYTVDPSRDGVNGFEGGINELHQRFREKELEIFRNSGAEIIAVWQDLGRPGTLVYMLAYRDRAHRDEVWAAFSADPEWNELRLKYNVPLSAETHMLSATDYSPLK
jgi:NIPSNAP